MIITIDTEKDSSEQLRRAAEFLLSLSGSSSHVMNEPVVRQPSPETVELDEGIFDIFDKPDDDSGRDPAPARVHPY